MKKNNQFTSQDLINLIRLANKLDGLGLYKEADAIDQALFEKKSGLSDLARKLVVNPAFGLALLSQPNIQPESQIQEARVEAPESPRKTTLDALDFFEVKIAPGDNLTKIVQQNYPGVDTPVMMAIIKEIYKEMPIIKQLYREKYKEKVEEKDPTKLVAGKILLLPRLEALEELAGIDYGQKFGVRFQSDESIKDYSQQLFQYMKEREKPDNDKDGTFNGKVYDTGVTADDLTIGYGHKLTEDEKRKYKAGEEFLIHGVKIKKGREITEEQASHILTEDLKIAKNRVGGYNFNNLDQNQFDALVSMAFNIGNIPVEIRTLIVQENKESVPDAFLEFGGAKGRSVGGLRKRRLEEVGMWSRGEYKVN